MTDAPLRDLAAAAPGKDGERHAMVDAPRKRRAFALREALATARTALEH